MYGPDYIMLARSDDGDESNIDAESGHLLGGATGRQPAASLDGSAWLWVALRTLEENPSRSFPLGVVWCHPPSARVKA